ncbi:hypothetical protein FQN52_005630 [Onygenales sp. PD_12]|nr:hypothetical protein FQN52_005630 [Onygenales sp. PD_12]KAK2797956.1 hypothetical protein FQN51_008135 [Onygenales sp. PD_10]
MATGVDWENGEHSSLVSIGTHRLLLSVYGPNRDPGSPIVIIMPGVASSIKEWVGVRRTLQPVFRTLLYERAGLGDSDQSPNEPTAANIALELDLLLSSAAIKPPYVIVCHSYGGITSREFLHLKMSKGEGDHISGIVFVDANQEKSVQLWPDEVLSVIGKGVDRYEVTGLNRDMVLNDEERKAMFEEKASEKRQKTAELEMKHYINSCAILGDKKQLEAEPPLLDSRPVSVLKGNCVRDHERIYEAGVKLGNGTTEERLAYQRKLALYREKDESLQKGNLRLSTKNHFAVAEKSGHSVHLTEPGAIFDEVKWVFDNI